MPKSLLKHLILNNMKKTILISSIFSFVLIFAVFSCKKDSTKTTTSTADEATLQVQTTTNAADQASIQSDDDAISNDAARGSETTIPTFSTAPSLDTSFDNGSVTVDRRPILNGLRKIYIRYPGIRYLGITKTGTITVELIAGNKWTDVGATLKQTFDSVTITNNITGKTRVYNGVRYITNVNGGNNYIGAPDTAKYRVRVYANVTFDNGTTKNYWVARLNSFAKTAKVFTSEGDTLAYGAKCSIGGTSRYNKEFHVEAPQAYQTNAVCGWANPSAGIRSLITDNRTITVTYGVDAAGNQVSSGCAYGYKVSWTKLNGTTGTYIVSY